MGGLRGFIGLALCTGLTAFIVAGCSQTGATGPAGPKLTGTISGFVYLVNANGEQDTVRDSVKVFIEGIGDTVLTNSMGLWSIPNLETGIYTIRYNKIGYGESRSEQVQYLGGGPRNLGIVYLVKPPAFNADSIAWLRRALKADSTNVRLFTRLTDTTIQGPYRLLVVLGRDSVLSSVPSPTSASLFITGTFLHGLDTANIRLTPTNFASEGYQSGDSLWLTAFVANAGSQNSGYVDVTTEKTVYTCINSTPSVSVRIVVP